MKIMLLGIAIILFGIAVILCSSGAEAAFGLGVSFIGLLITGKGFLGNESDNIIKK